MADRLCGREDPVEEEKAEVEEPVQPQQESRVAKRTIEEAQPSQLSVSVHENRSAAVDAARERYLARKKLKNG